MEFLDFTDEFEYIFSMSPETEHNDGVYEDTSIEVTFK